MEFAKSTIMFRRRRRLYLETTLQKALASFRGISIIRNTLTSILVCIWVKPHIQIIANATAVARTHRLVRIATFNFTIFARRARGTHTGPIGRTSIRRAFGTRTNTTVRIRTIKFLTIFIVMMATNILSILVALQLIIKPIVTRGEYNRLVVLQLTRRRTIIGTAVWCRQVRRIPIRLACRTITVRIQCVQILTRCIIPLVTNAQVVRTIIVGVTNTIVRTRLFVAFHRTRRDAHTRKIDIRIVGRHTCSTIRIRISAHTGTSYMFDIIFIR